MNNTSRVTIRKRLAERRIARGGMTLTELLVVIVILAILASTTVGMLGSTMQGSQIREAARVLSSTLAVTRYRAQETGRPAGLMIRPLANGTAAIDLVPVEEPPNYGGLTTGARLQFDTQTGASNTTREYSVSLVNDGFGSASQLIERGLVAPGDRLQLDYKGHKFTVLGANGNTLTLSSHSHNPSWPNTGTSYAFSFLRRPRPSASAPVTLPDGAVIDMTLSGWGDSDRFAPSSNVPVIIMFSPSGNVDRIFYPSSAGGTNETIAIVNPPISLFVGRIEKIGTTTSENLGSLESRWVAVNAQTGMVGTYENANLGTPTPTVSAANVALARKYIRTGQSMGE